MNVDKQNTSALSVEKPLKPSVNPAKQVNVPKLPVKTEFTYEQPRPSGPEKEKE